MQTVSARSANNPAAAATPELVDKRRTDAVRAGTYPYDGGEGVVTGWHVHNLHEIEYAFRGTVEVETQAGRHLLPPQQAAWIPAWLPHRTTVHRDVRTMAVFLGPEMVPDSGGRARVLAAAPVIREMILYAGRWPIGRAAGDPSAERFFAALADLVAEWLDRESPLFLPTSTDPVTAAAIAHTAAHLGAVTATEVCRAVGVSERTLRRCFRAELGMSWRAYLLQARLLRAMALLAEPGPTVLDVATAVGFDSGSAFTRAFARATGETPTAYRRRVTTGAA